MSPQKKGRKSPLFRPSNLSDLRQQPFVLYAEGRFQEALALINTLRDALTADAPVTNLAAVCHMQLGNLEDAMRYWQRALVIKPDYCDVHNNLGNLYCQLERFAEAEASYRQALRFKPDYGMVHNNLGKLLYRTSRFDEAEVSLRQALRINPNDADAYNTLGALFKEMRRFEEAERAYRHLLQLKPSDADARYNLALLFDEFKFFEKAQTHYREALQIDPNHCNALNNLGVLLEEGQRFDEAEAAYRQVMQTHPTFVDAINNLGNLLVKRRRFAEAESCYRQGLILKCPKASYHLGNLCKELRRFEEAEAFFQQALAIQADFIDARWNLGLLYLSLGRFLEGWPLYECRQSPRFSQRNTLPVATTIPMWRGESLEGKSVMLIPEQGIGDQIQFCRYVPLLKSMGVVHLTVVCDVSLTALLASLSGGDAVLEKWSDTDHHHDFWIYYLSIPGRLQTQLHSIPDRIPYLSVSEERYARWGKYFRRDGLLRVGLVWKGNANHRNDAQRSLPHLRVLAPLWSVPGVIFVSLQKGEAEGCNPPPEQPFYPLGETVMDFADTAAIVAHLDLVISIDSAVAHLAGALGKRCWVLLPAWNTDWRWLHGRTDSPWYPGTMRLFRQTHFGDWSEVVQQMVRALEAQDRHQ